MILYVDTASQPIVLANWVGCQHCLCLSWIFYIYKHRLIKLHAWDTFSNFLMILAHSSNPGAALYWGKFYLGYLVIACDNLWYLGITCDNLWNLVICEDFWWYLVWLYLVTSGYIWLYLVIPGYIWLYLVISGDVWWYLVISGDIWWYLVISGDTLWYLW